MTNAIPPAPKFTTAQLGQTCLVTGGAGYVGSAIIRRLREHGCRVRSLDVIEQNHADPQVEALSGDLRNFADVQAACTGVDTVFHTAAIINLLSIYRPAVRRLVYDVNCVGTQNLLRAAAAAKVTALVHTSSFNVVLDRVLNDQDESTPYASKTADLYSLSKIEAERSVLATHDRDGLRTCALRPGGIWGSDSKSMMIRSFLEELARGKFKVLIGNGEATMDNTHIDNLVDAQLLAASGLRRDPEVVGGQAYFITDDEAVNGLKWFQPLVEGLGEPFPKLYLPAGMMRGISRVMELVHFLGGPEPLLTHRGLRNLTESSSFRIDKARRELNYSPRMQRSNGMPQLLPQAREFVDQFRNAAKA